MEPGDVAKPGVPASEPEDLFTPLAPYTADAEPAPEPVAAAAPAPVAAAPSEPIAAPPAPEPEPVAEPRRPLAVVLREVLAALAAGKLETALATEGAYVRARSAPDEPEPTPADLAMWNLARELTGVAAELPPPLVRYLTTGLEARDLGSIWPALGAFRAGNPSAAAAANTLLRTRAPGIFARIDGALWSPVGSFPAPRPYSAPIQLPSQSRRGAYGGLGIAGVVAFGVIRAMISLGTSSSHYNTFDNFKMPDMSSYNDPQIDLSALQRSADLYAAPAPMPVPPATQPTSTDTADDLDDKILLSLRTLQRYDVASAEQVDAAATFEDYALDHDCKKMLAGLPKLAPDAPPAPLPSRIVQAHLDSINARVKQRCGKKGKPAPKHAAPKRPAAPTPTPVPTE